MIDAEFAGAAIREAIAEERKAANDWLAKLDRIEAEINGKVEAAPAPASPPRVPATKPKGKSKVKKKQPTAPVHAAVRRERGEAIVRVLTERGGIVSSLDLRQAVGFTPEQFRKAATQLVEDGKLERHGARSQTAYSLADATAQPPAPKAPRVGVSTLQGRIMMTLQEVEFATCDELADLLGETTQTITRECGALIVENEILMENRGVKHGYILAS